MSFQGSVQPDLGWIQSHLASGLVTKVKMFHSLIFAIMGKNSTLSSRVECTDLLLIYLVSFYCGIHSKLVLSTELKYTF